MKINISLNLRLLLRAFYVLPIVCIAVLVMPERADAQVYVSQVNAGIVSKYSLTTGKLVKADFITGLTEPNAMVVYGNDLLIATVSGAVGKYNATTGAAISQSFITGTGLTPCGLALSGEDLYVASSGEGTIGKYNVVTGKAINAGLITGLPSGTAVIFGVGVSGDGLYVSDSFDNALLKFTTAGKPIGTLSVPAPYGVAFLPGIVFVGSAESAPDGVIGTYKALTGKTINADFITGLSIPYQIALDGDKLFVANHGTGTVGEYNATTGKAINATFISGLTTPVGVAIKK